MMFPGTSINVLVDPTHISLYHREFGFNAMSSNENHSVFGGEEEADVVLKQF